MSHIKKVRTEALFSKTDLVAGTSPALGISPRLGQQVTSLIWYTRKKPHKGSVNPETYITAIDEFLKPYDDINPSLYVDCKVTQPKPHQYCMFTKKDLGPCGKDGYGYKNDKPCIYLKLNKLKDWRPEHTSENEITTKKFSSTKKQTVDIPKGKVDITCNGITCFDTDHMGNISYYPGPFLKTIFFLLMVHAVIDLH
ncbi:sodium/potassium-dependent atpase beta subunit [Holotrichia oblita]|uniref:Sodium/potassium-dependent atpase beta subunit n=1 Tax=Holotrichia oblita TaxID=644536 RepID=A0ACB9TFS8_HOLOL|nr:sodium/potassium-dependent atpase beta subunit [Holotrichia oblita]